ncbi:uncharacterized protein LOC124651925 [Lolium rigidum]|uniref:uncharacterized protein LOC124651925 n=1 Tax=Lolium rigidum TaxID=89674 RepID=UPI001F5DEBAF|nr:uncharacterized protein LOC124651925 [Lolium rigidum]
MASREAGAGGAHAASRPPPLRVGRTREHRMGRDTQLLAADGGAPVSLFVLCGHRFEAAQLFRSGEMSVGMVRVDGHPVSMATCAVGDHHWMLARDALVARVDARVFVFELPGFFYAVVVPPDADGGVAPAERRCDALAEIFARFCAYQDIASNAEGTDEPDEQSQHWNPWVRAHARIQRLGRPTTPPGHAAAVEATAATAAATARQMERAVRTSAVVKLLNHSLLAGAIQPARHLTITIGARAEGTATQLPAAFAAALPSKSVVSDLLDAIETCRTSAPRRELARRGNGPGWWSLNVEGVMMLLRVVQAMRGRRLQATPLGVGPKRPRDEGNGGAGHDGLRGGGGAAFGGGTARRRCGGTQRKLGSTLGACGSS